MSDNTHELFEDLEIETLLYVMDSLPVDVSFVDRDDVVTYFNLPKDGRIFPRTKLDLGRKVQRCHPPKSVHIVQRILDDFRAKKRKNADFWIDLGGKLVYIRYFPIYDKDGEYYGTVEVTQDVTGIRKLEGEKRLLDEESL